MADGEVTINIAFNANPLPTITMDRTDRMPIRDEDTRVTIGTASIVFQSLNDLDARNYTVEVTNAAGTQMATFVLCEFEPHM